MKVEVQYVHHCDEECGLGQAWYLCPACDELQIDGDLFMKWVAADYLPQAFRCLSCGVELEEDQ